MRYIPDDVREDLERAIDVLLPLDTWVNEPNKWKPPNGDSLPWRNGSAKLNAKSLQIVPLIDAFIAASSDGSLIDRFREIAQRPLAHSPIERIAEWRAARGLHIETEFGVVESQNVLFDAGGQPATRADIYRHYLPLFRSAVAGFKKDLPPKPFEGFVDGLLADNQKFWPDPLPTSRPSFFIRQLLKDSLFTILEMRGPLPEPWNSAVAAELGEHRRPGNKYGPADADAAVDAFKTAMKQTDPGGPAITTAAPPPVGSPPITHP